jgi:hypothetical protein
MKRAALILFVMAVVAVTVAPSQARHYRHGWCGYGPYHDFSHSNSLSPLSFIFPVADWGPFFRCRMYYSPAETLLPYGPYGY